MRRSYKDDLRGPENLVLKIFILKPWVMHPSESSPGEFVFQGPTLNVGESVFCAVCVCVCVCVYSSKIVRDPSRFYMIIKY